MSPKLIVLVEDDANLRHSIALILQRAGYIVTATDCVYTAMDIIQSGKYHMVISDINIPETQKVLLPKVLNKYPSLSIVILTDQSLTDAEKEERILGSHYLLKPIAPERLLDNVGTLLGNKSNSNHINNKNNLPDNHS